MTRAKAVASYLGAVAFAALAVSAASQIEQAQQGPEQAAWLVVAWALLSAAAGLIFLPGIMGKPKP